MTQFQENSQFLSNKTDELEKRISTLSTELTAVIISDYVSTFNIKEGVVLPNQPSFSKLNKIWKDFHLKTARSLSVEISSVIKESLDRAVSHFKEIGLAEAALRKAIGTNSEILKRIGISESGALMPQGFLYRITEAAEVREEIRSYITKAVSRGVSLRELTVGLRELIEGSKGIDGSYVRYWRVHGVDIYYQADSYISMRVAETMQLRYFRYVGGVIKTTRKFCRSKNDNVYSVAEVTKGSTAWKNDPTLPQSANFPPSSYNPLIDRGRWNCRHRIMYINKREYDRLKNE